MVIVYAVVRYREWLELLVVCFSSQPPSSTSRHDAESTWRSAACASVETISRVVATIIPPAHDIIQGVAVHLASS